MGQMPGTLSIPISWAAWFLVLFLEMLWFWDKNVSW